MTKIRLNQIKRIFVEILSFYGEAIFSDIKFGQIKRCFEVGVAENRVAVFFYADSVENPQIEAALGEQNDIVSVDVIIASLALEGIDYAHVLAVQIYVASVFFDTF